MGSRRYISKDCCAEMGSCRYISKGCCAVTDWHYCCVVMGWHRCIVRLLHTYGLTSLWAQDGQNKVEESARVCSRSCVRRTAHLSNVSLNKGGSGVDCVWSGARFSSYLEEVTGRLGVWQRQLLPEFKRLVVCALRCAQNDVRNRKASFELYGFDIMIDEVSVDVGNGKIPSSFADWI